MFLVISVQRPKVGLPDFFERRLLPLCRSDAERRQKAEAGFCHRRTCHPLEIQVLQRLRKPLRELFSIVEAILPSFERLPKRRKR
jgi:hypothetical protein